jgi:diguanylate cyclase (GGDEF)-like protein/PAS domain S-box-containing protein
MMVSGAGCVLVADDDAVMRRMCSITLRHAGHAVIEVASGEAALASLGRNRVDLVLLDIQMGGMDGFETCRQLRCMPGSETLPVIMLTGLDNPEAIENAYHAGATDFMTKPFQWSLLAQRVRYALRAAHAAEESRQAASRLERAQRLAQLGHWSMSLDGKMSCSDELAHIFGAGPDHAECASPQEFLERVLAEDRPRILQARRALVEHGQSYDHVYSIRRFDGQVRTVHEQAQLMRDARGQPQAMEGVTQDITARVEAEHRIQSLSSHDTLTGLPNREHFRSMLDSALGEAHEHREPGALVELDLDRFRSVNDALGLPAGDVVLKAMVGRLQDACRALQLQRAAVLGRVGPNSFCVYLPCVSDPAEISELARRLQRAIAEPLAAGTQELRITASAGIAQFPRDACDSLTLLRHVEHALYAAKQDANGSFLFYDAAVSVEAGSLLVRESDLRRGIEADELRAYLQPKVDARCGKTVGAEILVRWEHPQRGLLAPAEFVPLAESTGLIIQIGEWMLEQACRLVAGWQAKGLIAVPVSVNITATHFMSDDLMPKIDALLQRLRLSPSVLVLEVTESLLVRNLEKCTERMQALRGRGIALSLDDFGTGYSSLSYLKAMPLDELKLDRSFVTGVATPGRDRSLAAAIVSLAQLLELNVVAEGVEDAEQSAALLAMGCHVHQGYLYSRPLPVARFAEFLESSGTGTPAMLA